MELMKITDCSWNELKQIQIEIIIKLGKMRGKQEKPKEMLGSVKIKLNSSI